MHLFLREIPQNYHTFALFDHFQMGNLIGRRVGNQLSHEKSQWHSIVSWLVNRDPYNGLL